MSEYDDRDIDETDTTPDVSDGVQEQLTEGDTLERTGLKDQLDEGYSPPDRDPHIDVPTQAEEEAGLSLDELLSAEEPDVSADDPRSGLFDEEGEEVGDSRSGRLVSSDLGEYEDTEKELWGEDVGIDGAAASAEEAAVHVIDPEANEI
ncbi:hypothetical protein GIS00_07670 [Nakamurella sp. YIM 132087]|uniref:DUF5709 domain-containing protein n=1 Tax=Nakamurella alba TaxID=2665158 RepID=A0A7K1FI96_9ACTN|nr:DUF5709 domain-containing protein [Nakamurella alba]MTD13818.1 hypothetical protein [Nakamurella alba]